MAFIVIEGIDGSGKSSQIKAVNFYLNSININNITVREPGNTEVGELVRSILLNGSIDKIESKTELLLFMASRYHNIKKNIEPALDNKTWVLCDRFHASSVAYQGYGRNVDLDIIKIIADWLYKHIVPDINFIIDIDPQTALFRKNKQLKNKLEDRYEQLDINFYNKVRQGYLQLVNQNPDKFILLNGEQDIKTITEQIITQIQKLL